jgi:hypothetical protein
LMLNGETMWVDVRTIATLEQRTGDRFMVHARKRNGQALVSRKPTIIFSGRGRSPYNGRWTPKRKAALREARWWDESLGRHDEFMVADRYSSTISGDALLYGEP